MEYGPLATESFYSSFFDVLGTPDFGKMEKCGKCGQTLVSLVSMLPIQCEIEIEGKEIGDFIFGPVGSILTSERFRAKYQNSNLTGITQFYPIEVNKVKIGKKIAPLQMSYFLPSLSKIGRLDIEKSGVEEAPICKECMNYRVFKRIKRVVLEPHIEENYDIFIPLGLSQILVTAAFKDFCEKEEIKNGFFIPAEKFTQEFYPWENKDKSNIESEPFKGLGRSLR